MLASSMLAVIFELTVLHLENAFVLPDGTICVFSGIFPMVRFICFHNIDI